MIQNYNDRKNVCLKNSFRFVSLLVVLFFAVPSLSAQVLYWEEAALFSPQAGTFPVSAHSDEFSVIAWQEARPVTGTAAGSIFINLAVKEAGGEWQQRGIIAGPYAFLGTEPSILSLVIDNSGRIVIAAAAGRAQTEILISANRGLSFSRHMVSLGAENSVAPRLFVRADGGYLLFVTRGQIESLSIYYSRSDDGITWSTLEPFVTERNLSFNFLPAHASTGERDIVFFQSRVMGSDTTAAFQLFFKISDNNGITWTTARQFTTFTDPAVQIQSPANSFDNQRPHLIRHVTSGNLFLVWERRFSNRAPQIYAAAVDRNGNLVGSVERVNNVEAFCQNPIGFIHNNSPAIVWFDNRRGNNQIILAQRENIGWQNFPLSNISAEASFARPVVSQGNVYIFWQTTIRDSRRINILAPKTSVASPMITAVNFTPSTATRSERARVTWNIPADSAGIHGFSWTWSRSANAIPPETVMIYNTGNTQNLNLEHYADEDGPWYFSVRAHDNAGNWSQPARTMFYRKTTPPPQLTIITPEADERGFLPSNTFNMLWEPSLDPFLSGYTWNLQYLGANENANINAPPSRIMGTGTSVNFVNQDNGIWAFTVSAIDQAGNIGSPSHITFRTNRFIPYTSITHVDARQDEQGVLSIRITGRGFTTGGQITSIVLEQEGREDQAASNFNIISDREIDGLVFENIDEGEYRLRLNHSGRGWHTADPFIPVNRTETVKFGDFSREWRPSWTIRNYRTIFNLDPVMALVGILIIFCALGIFAIIRGIGGVITESHLIKQETLAILTGDFMPMEKKQRIVQIQKRGTGLRFKFLSFTTGLILLVVIMLSIPMYLTMTQTQQRTLLESLWDRSKILLEVTALSTRSFLPMALQSMGERGTFELALLPAQTSTLQEANYLTITGYGIGSIHTDHVWASNDPDILSKIDTTELRRGTSRILDDISHFYFDNARMLNTRAQEDAGELSQSIRDLYEEGIRRALDVGPEAERIRENIQMSISAQEMKLNTILTGIEGEIGSFPQFSVDKIGDAGTYIFYKPIMYRQGADDNYYRGLIRLEVSLDIIVEKIYQGQMNILQTIGIVAFVVLLIGIIGAFIFSAVIIMPIKKLVKHIEIIRDTEDKAKLAGMDIDISSKDEIAILGKTINDMTHGLVKAALAASDLSIGKEIQKKFIPLEVDIHGNKQSSGYKKTSDLNFFGYYEGAKGVSGDYFDYKDLDGRYYAVIKCDVAGKGIPAALIMIQVATIFLGYFKQWKPDEKGMHIEDLVYQINDFIETLAFKGRFAAFTLCLFDSKTGIVRFCNAGDNVVHYYDASEGRKKAISLPQTPATGVLPNFMIESTGGYKVQTVQIDKGDILLLYTDGIEEAKRRFRDLNFKEIICTEGPVDTPHGNHLCGQADEEMGPERVEAIIDAVMARKVYTLQKYHNPEGDTELQFDFSRCEGNVEDVIMALVSVEKIFRCYKPVNAEEDSRVLVDKKVDEFLKNHFLQYRRYCLNTREYPENPAYMYYTHLMEDEQYDDLTILGIKRN